MFAGICVSLLLVGGGIVEGTGKAGFLDLFAESFDAAVPPALPPGWVSSSNRTAGTADLVTTASSPLSPPHAVLGTNATVEQWLTSCSVVADGGAPEFVSFALRRSSTFVARCIVEASVDGGITFPFVLGEAPPAGSSTAYQQVRVPVPPGVAQSDSFMIRWHFLPAATGATGTVRLDDVRILRAVQTVTRGTVVINEICHQPPSGTPEWMELMNTGSDPVDIDGWAVADDPGGAWHVLGGSGTVLQPGGYCVLTSDSLALRAVMQDAGIPLLQPAGFPTLNNAGDQVLVRTSSGAIMDSLRYDAAWGGGPGISLERKDPAGPSTSGANWGSSTDGVGATPGRANSIIIQPHDLRVRRVHARVMTEPFRLFIDVVMENAGTLASGPCLVEAMQIEPGGQPMQIAAGTFPDAIAPADSALCLLTVGNPRPGRLRVRCTIQWPEDTRPENNSAEVELIIPFPAVALRVNEIHAAPVGGEGEFIEIVNAGTAPVSAGGCWLTDRPLSVAGGRRWVIGEEGGVLAPGELCVIAGDSSLLWWPGGAPVRCTIAARSGLGLDNDGDAVYLYAPDSVLVDSVVFSAVWHSANIPDPSGRSLERYHPLLPGADPRSWGTSVDPAGATPGRPNSILLAGLPPATLLACAPDPFSPDGDGHDDATVIRFRLPVRSALVRMRVYDVRGRCVRELLNGQPAAAEGAVVWDGLDHVRAPLRIGIYIVLLEAIDGAGGQMVVAKAAVVLARRL